MAKIKIKIGENEIEVDSRDFYIDNNTIGEVIENAEKWRKAEKFYRELISIDPDNPEHYRGMSRVKLQQGEPDQSKRFLDKAKALGG